MNPILCSAAASLIFSTTALQAAEYHVFIGTYTGEKSKGIYRYSFNDETGSLQDQTLAAEVSNPSFLAIHPGGNFLYAVSEGGNREGAKAGSVTAYRLDKTSGKLSEINWQPSGGGGPCHIAVNPAGTACVIANYGGGSVVSYAINQDGSLSKPVTTVQHQGSSVNPNRQKEPHAHSVNIDPAGKFVFAADLGLDQVIVYKLGNNAELSRHSAVKTKAGGGPRHFTLHPGGKFAYSNLEMTSEVTAFTWNSSKGELAEIQTISSIPEATPGNSTAEILAHPNGKFLYCSNRGHDSIAAYKIDSATGQLTRVENESIRGKTPRNFAIDPSGKFVIAAGQSSGTLAVFKINQETGELSPAGEPVSAPNPVCIRFLKKH